VPISSLQGSGGFELLKTRLTHNGKGLRIRTTWPIDRMPEIRICVVMIAFTMHIMFERFGQPFSLVLERMPDITPVRSFDSCCQIEERGAPGGRTQVKRTHRQPHNLEVEAGQAVSLFRKQEHACKVPFPSIYLMAVKGSRTATAGPEADTRGLGF